MNTTAINVHLDLTCFGNQFKSQSELLDWVRACLNCNTNHVEATVSLASVPTLVLENDSTFTGRIVCDGVARVILLDGDVAGIDAERIKSIFGEDMHVVDSPAKIDVDHVAAVLGALDGAAGLPAYEVTASGFDGSSDETDDRVFWVAAASAAEVNAAIAGTGAQFRGIITVDSASLSGDIDFSLSKDIDDLRAALIAFKK